MHLAQATRFSRAVIKYTIFAGIGLFIFYIILSIFTAVVPILFPPKTPAPTLAFGKIKKISYPPYPQVLNYQINTISGNLPTFPTQIKIYKIKKSTPTLYSLRDVRARVSGQGFSKRETKLSDVLFRWNNERIPEKSIKYNILTHEFYISSNYLNDQSQIPIGNPPSGNKAFTSIINFLGGMGQDLSDIDQLKNYVFYFKIANNSLVRLNNLNEAQVVRIDLFQKPIDKIDIYYPHLEGSTMRFWIAKSNSYNVNILEAFFKHQQADLSYFATYPIKSSSQAFEDLRSNRAFIYNPQNQQNIVITDSALGYFIGVADQDYLIPIIVFTGKNFKAYVQALPDSVIF
ncbi:MAG: hypothetical protein A2857_05710 [Candidatus Levybacteria bacterium RIFCSPHIGHO2_01_FULL_36_15]|nr:MAG: hypothetical protein A2857_05710 [Candidatus Levybacteria bacterium RIFCSPHIGHO2_01_FULL_36_15]OGH38397.1 MAG: hypothetical protein A2905_00510 [Candidatus Levybacteria bacterium RIFCSPLOWO2_01_FULL_36_10]